MLTFYRNTKYTVPTNLLEFVGTAVPTNLSEQYTWCSNRKKNMLREEVYYRPIPAVGTVVPTNLSEQYTVYSVIRFFEIIYIFITFNQSNIYDHTIHGTYLDSVPISFFFPIVTPP